MTSKHEAGSPPPYTELSNEAIQPQIPNEPPPKYEPPTNPDNSQEYQSNSFGYQAVPVQSQIVLINQHFTDNPAAVQCHHCFKYVTTTLEYQSGALTWLTAGLLCLFGCWPCCPVPFCMTDLMDVKHRCPMCKMILGTYRRLD